MRYIAGVSAKQQTPMIKMAIMIRSRSEGPIVVFLNGCGVYRYRPGPVTFIAFSAAFSVAEELKPTC
jgi:hypothetical protein